jgi:hypothetical protein
MSKQWSEAAKSYRGDYAFVTTGSKRNVTIIVSHEEFARLDAIAREKNITRGALARNIVMDALQRCAGDEEK